MICSATAGIMFVIIGIAATSRATNHDNSASSCFVPLLLSAKRRYSSSINARTAASQRFRSSLIYRRSASLRRCFASAGSVASETSPIFRKTRGPTSPRLCSPMCLGTSIMNVLVIDIGGTNVLALQLICPV